MGSVVEASGDQNARSGLVSVATIAIYLGLLATDVFFLMVEPNASWDVKIGLLLGILGVYTFSFGLLAETEVFDWFPFLNEELTSPNLFEFADANRNAVGSVFLALGNATRTAGELRTVRLLKRAENPLLAWLAVGLMVPDLIASVLILILRTLVTVVSIGFYLLVVAPIAYTAYLVVSICFEDFIAELATERETDGRVASDRAVAHEHRAKIRNLLVGIPSLLLSPVVLNVSSLF
jgi:hypothetical protein